MIDLRSRRVRTGIILHLIGLGAGLAAEPVAAQKAPAEAPAAPIRQVVARLRSSCAADPDLRRALVLGGTLDNGALMLTGTVERPEQAGLIEAEAGRLLDATPLWKPHFPGGVSAAKLAALPIRGDLMPWLQRALAKSGAEANGRVAIEQQTRVDDLYFDADGRLQVVGLCINQPAYLAFRSNNADRVGSFRSDVARAAVAHLRSYPLPQGVPPQVLKSIATEKLAFEESPAKRLQQWANEAKREDVLFRDARFDGEGMLTFDGLVGADAELAEVAKILARPDILRGYARPDGKPPVQLESALAGMRVLPNWPEELRAGLQERMSRAANRGTARDGLRFCRVDRAVFLYPARSPLTLHLEGVVLRPVKGGSPLSFATAIQAQCKQLLLDPNQVSCGVTAALTPLPNPLPKLREKVAGEPALDGVRLEDLTFGPRGEPTLEGRWTGPDQEAALAAILTPALAELTEGRVVGPIACKLTDCPTDRLLRNLRRKAGEAFDETSLDRLLFVPADKPGETPVLTLRGATPAADRPRVEKAIGQWLAEDDLAGKIDIPVTLGLKNRPSSLLADFRRLAASDPALDGLRIVRGRFDEENVLVVSGSQDHEGQAERAVALVGQAWRTLPSPVLIRAGTFPIDPIQSRFATLRFDLLSRPAADNVLLDRVYYDDGSTLLVVGRTSDPTQKGDQLRYQCKLLLKVSEVRFRLARTPFDPDRPNRTLKKAIDALIGGNLQNIDRAELDEAVLLAPTSSTAWYLRGAYYFVTGNRELAERNLARVRKMEDANPGPRHERYLQLERFQNAGLRTAIDDLMAGARLTR